MTAPMMASSTNGAWVYQREAPTMRMMLISSRREYAAICTMFTIRKIAATACTAATKNAALRMESRLRVAACRSSPWSTTS